MDSGHANHLGLHNGPDDGGGILEIRSLRFLLIVIGLAGICFGVALTLSDQLVALLLNLVSVAKGHAPDPQWPQVLRIVGLESTIVGFLLVLLGTVVLSRWHKLRVFLAKDSVLIIGAAMVLVATWLPVMLVGRSAVIAGQRYWWLGDDAMISMRFARNLANGLGLVWNAGERVEGYTNPLWTLWMAVWHLFPNPTAQISLAVHLSNLILGLATIPVIVALVRALGGQYLAALASVASYVLSRYVLYSASYGLETTCLTLLVVFATFRVLRDAQLQRPRLLTYIAIGSLSLVRTDAIVLSALLYLMAVFLAEQRRKALLYSAISLALPASAELLRILYYGDILPNTAYLKAIGWSNKYLSGLRYSGGFLLRFLVPLICAAVGSIITKNKAWRSVLVLLVVYLLYITYIGGDAFAGYRFFIPVLPLLTALAFVVIEQAGPPRIRDTHRLIVGVLCFISMPLIVPGYGASLFPYPGDVGNVEIGLLLSRNTEPTARVADVWAGSVFYFSERYGIDLLGKSDPYIARLPAKPYGTLPGHNKYDFDYSLGVLKPDYVVAPFKLPVNEEELGGPGNNPFPFRRELFLHPLFMKHCLPYPVSVESWRSIFACDWSKEMAHRNSWVPIAP